MADVDYGKVWSTIRFGLTLRRERLLAAYNAGGYEQESAQLDGLAREVTYDVQQVIEKGPNDELREEFLRLSDAILAGKYRPLKFNDSHMIGPTE